MRVRIDPYPVESVDGGRLGKLLDFAVAFHLADIEKFPVSPLLKIDLLLPPGVGKNRIWWDLVVGGELFHLPTMGAKESHCWQTTSMKGSRCNLLVRR
jgi:hypothetical protein